jgi:hypothetical protein
VSNPEPLRRFAVLGNHLPRQCGIATFTTHHAGALIEELPGVDGPVLAMNDAGRRHALATGSIRQLLDWLDRHGAAA